MEHDSYEIPPCITPEQLQYAEMNCVDNVNWREISGYLKVWRIIKKSLMEIKAILITLPLKFYCYPNSYFISTSFEGESYDINWRERKNN